MILNNTIKSLNKNDILNYLIVLYAFVLPTSRAGIGIITFLLLCFWIYNKNFKKDMNFFLQHRFFIVFGLFIMYSFIAVSWSVNYDTGLKHAARYWYFIPLFIISSSLKKEYISLVISAFLLGMLINEFLSYGMYFDLIEWKNEYSPFPTPFMPHLQYSLFIVFTSLLLLNYIFYTGDLRTKILYGIFFITVTINIFINGGRTGYIAFFLTIFLGFFLSLKRKLLGFFLSLIIIFFSVTLAYNYSVTFKVRVNDTLQEYTQISSGNFNTSVGQRILFIYFGGVIIKENPVFGVGTGGAMQTLQELILKEDAKYSYLLRWKHFHNVFLQTTVQLGFLGLSLLVLLFYYLYKIQIRNKYISNIQHTFITIFLITSLTGNMFHKQFTMALFSLIVGLVLAQYRIEKRKNLEIIR